MSLISQNPISLSKPVLLLTHSIKCSMCGNHYPARDYSRKMQKLNKSGNDVLCHECSVIDNKIKCKQRHIRKNGLYECVVCAKKFDVENGVEDFKLKGRYAKRSVCSAKCMRFYDKAVEYVKDIYKTNTLNARNIVASKWFERGVKQHEKDLRIQKANAA